MNIQVSNRDNEQAHRYSFSETNQSLSSCHFGTKSSLETGVTTWRNQLLMGLTTQNCGPLIAEKDY